MMIRSFQTNVIAADCILSAILPNSTKSSNEYARVFHRKLKQVSYNNHMSNTDINNPNATTAFNQPGHYEDDRYKHTGSAFTDPGHFTLAYRIWRLKYRLLYRQWINAHTKY